MLTLENVKEFNDALKGNPIYRLSLSSKELFHSNFLKWLIDSYKKEMGLVLNTILNLENYGEVTIVYRELKNRDLQIEFSSGNILVIEVKVKSVPAIEQLKKYYDVLYKECHKNKKQFKLSLLAFEDCDKNTPINFTNNEYCYTYISWPMILEGIEKIKIDNKYHQCLVEDYCDYMKNLHEMYKKNIVDWENDKNFFIDKETMKELENTRLHDLIFKSRYASLANKLTLLNKAQKKKLEDGSTGEIVVESNMTNGTGLTTMGYVLEGNGASKERTIVAGIQLQNKDNRFFLYANNFNNGYAKNIYKIVRSYNILFSDEELNNISPETRMRNDFCQYSDSFYYEYRRFDENKCIRPMDLCNMISNHVTYIQNNAEKFMTLINSINR